MGMDPMQPERAIPRGSHPRSFGSAVTGRASQVLVAGVIALATAALLIPPLGLDAALVCSGVVTYAVLLVAEASNRGYLVWGQVVGARAKVPEFAGEGLVIPRSYRT